MNDCVWIVELVDQDSIEIISVRGNEEKAKDEWQKQVDKQIKNLKYILNDDKFLFDYDRDYSLIGIKMYENLTLDNIKDADYSYYIPIIKKYEVL